MALADGIIENSTPGSVQWRHDHAMLLHSLLLLSDTTGRMAYGRFAEFHAERLARGTGYGGHGLEGAAVGCLLLEVWRRTRAGRCLRMARRIRKVLSLHPRSAAGVFWYRKEFAYRIWLDGLSMFVPFLCSFAREFNEPEAFDDVCGQLILVETWMRDPSSGLLYHAWDESRKHVWAHPETGCSPHFSARGMACFGVALVEALDRLPEGHPDRAALLAILARFAEAVVRHQDPASRLWFQVLDQPERKGNARDISASALLVASLGKAVRRELLEGRYFEATLKGFRGLLAHPVVQGSSSGGRFPGIGQSNEPEITSEWDGSFDWYVGRDSAPDDPFAAAAVILACTEIDRLRRGARQGP